MKEAPKINCSIISLKFLVALTKKSERTCVCESGEKYEKYISKVIPFHFAYMTVCMKYCYSLFTKRTFNIIFVYPVGLAKSAEKKESKKIDKEGVFMRNNRRGRPRVDTNGTK